MLKFENSIMSEEVTYRAISLKKAVKFWLNTEHSEDKGQLHKILKTVKELKKILILR